MRGAAALLHHLNDRYAAGRPSNDVATAGVFVRAFDRMTRTMDDAQPPWQPDMSTYDGRRLSDRWSGSIVNQRLPYVFMGTHGRSPFRAAAGMIISSSVANEALLCSYPFDGDTMGVSARRACMSPSCI